MDKYDRIVKKLFDGSARDAGPGTEHYGMRISSVLKQQIRFLAELNDVNLSKMGAFLLNVGVGQYIEELRVSIQWAQSEEVVDWDASERRLQNSTEDADIPF